MIQISNENIELLERFKFLLECESLQETLDFILTAFEDDIEESICEYLEYKETIEYINSDNYKEAIAKLKKLTGKKNV